MSGEAPPPTVEAVEFGGPAARWVLAATVLGSGLAFLDATVVNIARALEGMSSRPVEIELWIGADGLVRRVRWRDESSEEPRWSSETTTECIGGVFSDSLSEKL